ETHISEESAPVLLDRFDLRGAIRGDDPMPVEPKLPAIGHRFGQRDSHNARALPMSLQPRCRVQAPQIMGPPRLQMLGNRSVNLSNQSGPCDTDRCAGLHELSEVVEVQIIRPEVAKGVNADD